MAENNYNSMQNYQQAPQGQAQPAQQVQYQQPVYQQPVYYQPVQNSAATASLVCGILSIVGVLSLILGIVAIVQGKKGKAIDPNNGSASAGYIMGIIGTIMGVISTLVAIVYIFIYVVIIGVAISEGDYYTALPFLM